MMPSSRQRLSALCLFLVTVATLLAMPGARASDTDARRLSEFRSEGSQLMLRGQAASADLFIPLAATHRVESADIELQLTNSIALIEDRSVLRINFNGVTVGQVRLRRDRPEILATVALPAELWTPGFNRLQFAVSQQIESQCASPDEPELWTEINLFASWLRVNHRPAAAPLTLADLSAVFGTGIASASRVTLLTAPEALNDSLNQALPLVGQALALRRDYAPLSIRHGSWLAEQPATDDSWDAAARDALPHSAWYWGDAENGGVHVLVGRRDQLAGLLPAGTLEGISGAHLSLLRTPAVIVEDSVRVPSTVRLLVSGETDADVLTAARVLTEMDDHLNRTAQVDALASSRSAPDRGLLPARFLLPDRRYGFDLLGEGGATFRGSGTFRHALAFDLPPDFHVPESAVFKLALDFGYGAQMGLGSSMNLLLNGQLIHGLPLDNPGGEAFRAYRLDVSARQLRGGSNTLALEVTLRAPQSPNPCPGVSSDHLIFQLHDSSSLVLPPAGRAAVLPDLGLMADTGYPYLQTGETAPVNLYAADPALTGAALTLAGKLAQAAGVPLQQLTLAAWPQGAPPAGNHLLVGTPEALPESLFRDWSAAIGRSQRWPYRSLNDWRAVASGDAPALRGAVTQTGGLGDGALLAALANPAGSGTLSVVTADSHERLVARVNTLIEPTVWGQLRGDLAAWRDRESPVYTQQVAGGYTVGDPARPLDTLHLWLSNNPWYWALGVLAVITLAAWLLYRLLLRRNRRQQAEWEH